LPVSIEIPAIGVHSVLLRLGVKPNGTMQVPPLQRRPNAAGWYKYSVTTGQIGTSVIEGHVDNHQACRLLPPGGAAPRRPYQRAAQQRITAIFRVTGVRQYLKSNFPAKPFTARLRFAALRLITWRRLRLRHQPVPQLHRRIRVPRLITPGRPPQGCRLMTASIIPSGGHANLRPPPGGH
jgi:hypothetical protein